MGICEGWMGFGWEKRKKEMRKLNLRISNFEKKNCRFPAPTEKRMCYKYRNRFFYLLSINLHVVMRDKRSVWMSSHENLAASPKMHMRGSHAQPLYSRHLYISPMNIESLIWTHWHSKKVLPRRKIIFQKFFWGGGISQSKTPPKPGPYQLRGPTC